MFGSVPRGERLISIYAIKWFICLKGDWLYIATLAASSIHNWKYLSSAQRKAILTPFVTQEAFYFNRQMSFLVRFVERYSSVNNNQTRVAFQSYDTSDWRRYSYSKLLFDSAMENDAETIIGTVSCAAFTNNLKFEWWLCLVEQLSRLNLV